MSVLNHQAGLDYLEGMHAFADNYSAAEQEAIRAALREIDRLRAVNAKLLAACKGLVELLDAHGWGEGPALRSARAAIAEKPT